MDTLGARAVRRASVGDAVAIGLVHVRSWQATYRGQVPQDYLDGFDPAQRGEGWRRYLENGMGDREGLLVVDVDTEVVGFAAVGASRDEDRTGDGELRALYLLPEWWGHGVGRSLMEVAVATLAELGFVQATLWVLDANERARRFYKAGGWTPDGTSKQDAHLGFPITEVRYARRLT